LGPDKGRGRLPADDADGRRSGTGQGECCGELAGGEYTTHSIRRNVIRRALIAPGKTPYQAPSRTCLSSPNSSPPRTGDSSVHTGCDEQPGSNVARIVSVGIPTGAILATFSLSPLLPLFSICAHLRNLRATSPPLYGSLLHHRRSLALLLVHKSLKL
jgi:hypothetical protein